MGTYLTTGAGLLPSTVFVYPLKLQNEKTFQNASPRCASMEIAEIAIVVLPRAINRCFILASFFTIQNGPDIFLTKDNRGEFLTVTRFSIGSYLTELLTKTGVFVICFCWGIHFFHNGWYPTSPTQLCPHPPDTGDPTRPRSADFRDSDCRTMMPPLSAPG